MSAGIERLREQLIREGADYARHVVGDWFEVGSNSDGMCGRVKYENPVTTEYQTFSWSVTHPTCQSESEARAAARRTFEAETEAAS